MTRRVGQTELRNITFANLKEMARTTFRTDVGGVAPRRVLAGLRAGLTATGMPL